MEGQAFAGCSIAGRRVNCCLRSGSRRWRWPVPDGFRRGIDHRLDGPGRAAFQAVVDQEIDVSLYSLALIDERGGGSVGHSENDRNERYFGVSFITVPLPWFVQ